MEVHSLPEESSDLSFRQDPDPVPDYTEPAILSRIDRAEKWTSRNKREDLNMRYATISSACVNRLLEEGYLLGECDKAYIDEVTMMMLQENENSDGTDEDFILRVTSIGRLNLRRAKEPDRMASAFRSPEPELEVRPGIWKRAAGFIQSMTRGPRFY